MDTLSAAEALKIVLEHLIHPLLGDLRQSNAISEHAYDSHLEAVKHVFSRISG